MEAADDANHESNANLTQCLHDSPNLQHLTLLLGQVDLQSGVLYTSRGGCMLDSHAAEKAYMSDLC